MPTCALCEHVQPVGEACDACGHPFPRGEAVPVPVAPLEGLEPTVLDVPTPPGRDIPAMEELEPNGMAPGPAVPVEALAELEPTHAAHVAVAAEPIPDLEVTTAEGVPEPELPGPDSLACRYCRTPATGDEAFCQRCGMRLPWRDIRREAGTAEEARTCRACGTPVPGSACPSCGARARS